MPKQTYGGVKSSLLWPLIFLFVSIFVLALVIVRIKEPTRLRPSAQTQSGGEAEACWGNQGSDGRCYDCNGDSEINILDFSCFSSNWLKDVN